jgi:hypothetical protein
MITRGEDSSRSAPSEELDVISERLVLATSRTAFVTSDRSAFAEVDRVVHEPAARTHGR